MEMTNWFETELTGARTVSGAGSVIVIIATDAPPLPAQCEALARRVSLGLARTGTTGNHFSGDILLCFSTANEGGLRSTMSGQGPVTESHDYLAWGQLDPLYEGVVLTTEESVVNNLVAAKDRQGREGHMSFALPHDEIATAFQYTRRACPGPALVPGRL